MRLLVSGICAALCAAILASTGHEATGGEKPKYSIKQVMKQAHAGAKNSLLAKIASGEGTKEDSAKLVALYEALSMNEPPKGDAGEWKTRTTSLVDLAKAVQKGEEGAGKKLQAAAACAACHKLHK